MTAELREFDWELALLKQAIAESEEFDVPTMIAWFLYRIADPKE